MKILVIQGPMACGKTRLAKFIKETSPQEIQIMDYPMKVTEEGRKQFFRGVGKLQKSGVTLIIITGIEVPKITNWHDTEVEYITLGENEAVEGPVLLHLTEDDSARITAYLKSGAKLQKGPVVSGIITMPFDCLHHLLVLYFIAHPQRNNYFERQLERLGLIVCNGENYTLTTEGEGYVQRITGKN